MSELLAGAQRTTIAEDVARERRAERGAEIIDASALRRGEDWSYLSSKVVGAETP